MKKIILFLMIFSIEIVYANTHQFYTLEEQELIVEEYGRELQGKFGLIHCFINEGSLSEEANVLVAQLGSYFFSRSLHVTRRGVDEPDEPNFDIDSDILNPYIIEKLIEVKNDRSGYDTCLDIYESNEYKMLVRSYDIYMSNLSIWVEDKIEQLKYYFPEVVFYRSLENSKTDLGRWGFYQCMSAGLPDKDFSKRQFTQLSKDLRASMDYSEKDYNSISTYYSKVREIYLDPERGNPILGCFIVYDSSFINNAINKI